MHAGIHGVQAPRDILKGSIRGDERSIGPGCINAWIAITLQALALKKCVAFE